MGCDVATYRGYTIRSVSVPIPGEALHECIYVVCHPMRGQLTGIWHTKQGALDHIDFLLTP